MVILVTAAGSYGNLNFSAAQHYLDTKLQMIVCGRVFRRAQIFMGKYGKFIVAHAPFDCGTIYNDK